MVKIKKNLSEFAQQKRAQKAKKQLNPFEVHINKEKQKILGRKNKNDRGLPGISRAKAINRRKQSLLLEYKMANKDNIFLDKRIGERNSAMSMEDKAMARFARELRKMHKKNMYNLNDDEVLTHRGHTLEEIEKFDDPRSDDELSDEENSGKLDKNFVERAHFGGGILSKSDSASSRKDLIDQLIAESKKRKAEKQKIREQTIDLTEKLDSEWKDLLPLMSASKKPEEDTTEMMKADAYDIIVRELKFGARGTTLESTTEKKAGESTKNEDNNRHQDRICSDSFNAEDKPNPASNNENSLPYAYKVPENFDELKKLLEDQTSEYQAIIVDRIIKCNWIDNKNKQKLSNLFVYLLQHVNDCASTDDAQDLVRCFQVFDQLCPYIYDLAHVNPENAQICMQDIIKEKHDEFERNKRKYPDIDTLIFFKLVSLLFPTSDYRHAVVTPCLVFMSQILLKSRIKNRSDVARGLFVCTLILEYTALSKRFAPSAINFLRGILYTATSEALVQKIKIIPPFKATCNFLVIDEKLTDIEIAPNSAHMIASDLIREELDNEFRIRAVLTAINLIKEFKNQLQELEAVYSIFEPIHQLLKINKFKTYPLHLRKHIKKLRKEIEVLQNMKLKYMVREKKRPKLLKQYEPKIMTVYDGKQHRPMSKEKAEREKLLHKYKKEMKGAIREIRKDNSFLAKVRISQEIKSDAERKRKVKEIFGEAAVQQSELKKMRRK